MSMYSTKSAAICVALIIALVEIGSCLECYHCISTKDPKCTTNSTSSIKSYDCASQDSSMFSQLELFNVLPSKVFETYEGAPRFCHEIVLEPGTVVRACLNGDASNKNKTCDIMKESKEKIISCKVCNKDNCNGAFNVGPDPHYISFQLSALTLVTCYLFYKQ